MESESSHTVPTPSPSETPNTLDSDLYDNDDELTSRKRARTDSNKKPPSIPKSTRSQYWSHCERDTRVLENGSTKAIATCKYCKKEIPVTYGSTSGLKNHLELQCKLSPLYIGGKEGKSRPILTSESMGQGNTLLMHTFNKKICELKAAEYVITDEVSFRAIEGKGLRKWIFELQPRFKFPDRKKVAGTVYIISMQSLLCAGMVYDLFLDEKARIKSALSGQRVSLTSDTWTSIQNINYMVITAHFLDSEWKLHKRIINFTKINSHVGEEIGKLIEVCLREWGIEKVFSIVVDNATSNDTAIDYLRKRMKRENTLLFEGTYLHLRCSCHIINLIVKDGLKELESSIKAIRNSVNFIHSSPSRLNKFREFAVLAKFSSTSTVPMDVKTRWNATYKMLEVALKYRRVFDRMGEEWAPFTNHFHERNEKGKVRLGPPNEEDWDYCRAFAHFLKKFYDVTLELSASKTPTSQLMYQSMVALQLEIEKRRMDDSDQILQKVASSMKLKFEKYWGNWSNVNLLIFIANILDPRNKFQMIKVCIKNLGGRNTEEFIDKVKHDLVTLWSEYKRMNDVLIDENQNMQMVCDGRDSPKGGLGGIWDELYDDMKAQNEEEQLREIDNEVDKYLADDIEQRTNQSFNLLEWWKGSEVKYPILSTIAKDIFAIPSSTVASESAFSLGKRVVDPFRTSLSPKMVEALVCTSDWLKANEITLYKDPTEDDLELYKEIEEIEKAASVTQDLTLTTI